MMSYSWDFARKLAVSFSTYTSYEIGVGLISTPFISPHFFIHLSCCSWIGWGI